jgi:hypothetical protein
MPKMKLYVSPRRLIAPRPWMEAIGARPHILQADVAAVAESKGDVAQLLAGAHAHPSLVDQMTLVRGQGHSDAIALLLRMRVISMDEPGLYAWETAVSGNPVVKIDGDWYEVTGRFLHRPGSRQLTIAMPGPEDHPMPLVPRALARPDAAGRGCDPVRPGATVTDGSATPSAGEGE